jgi:hypothetical protein
MPNARKGPSDITRATGTVGARRADRERLPPDLRGVIAGASARPGSERTDGANLRLGRATSYQRRQKC